MPLAFSKKRWHSSRGTSCDDLSAACRAFEEQRLSASESLDPRVSKVYTPFGNEWFF